MARGGSKGLPRKNVKELNGIIDYLISNKSSYTSGAEFKIDGGWTAW